ncbi:MAG: Spy/CpxP family protein refolding chaperone [Candidatus Binataceae bacterium]
MRFTDALIGFLLAAAFALGVGYALGVLQPSVANAGGAGTGSPRTSWFGGWSHASYHHGGWGWCEEGDDSKMDEMLAHVEHELAITSAQRPKWDGFAAAVKAGATDLRSACTRARMTVADADAPQRLAQFEAMMSAGAAALKRVRPSFDGLYAGMNPEQREKVDSLFSRRHRW